jgi:hypothetical protein
MRTQTRSKEVIDHATPAPQGARGTRRFRHARRRWHRDRACSDRTSHNEGVGNGLVIVLALDVRIHVHVEAHLPQRLATRRCDEEKLPVARELLLRGLGALQETSGTCGLDREELEREDRTRGRRSFGPAEQLRCDLIGRQDREPPVVESDHLGEPVGAQAVTVTHDRVQVQPATGHLALDAAT